MSAGVLNWSGRSWENERIIQEVLLRIYWNIYTYLFSSKPI